MTDLRDRITRLRFTTGCEIKERGKFRRVTIEARPEYAIVRLEGMRTAEIIAWDAVRDLAVKMRVRSEEKERAAEKKRKKEGK